MKLAELVVGIGLGLLIAVVFIFGAGVIWDRQLSVTEKLYRYSGVLAMLANGLILWAIYLVLSEGVKQ